MAHASNILGHLYDIELVSLIVKSIIKIFTLLWMESEPYHIDLRDLRKIGMDLYVASCLSEVSCENCTHTAIAGKKKQLSKGCYAQRDSGGVWTTPEMSGQGLHWDSKGMYEGENTAVI